MRGCCCVLACLASSALALFEASGEAEPDVLQLLQREAFATEASESPLHLGQTPVWGAAVPKKMRILMFVPVGASHAQVIDLQFRNVQYVRALEKVSHNVSFDYFFVHYDLDRDMWMKKRGHRWYSDNIKYSAQMQGIKFNLGRQLLLNTTGLNISDYDWVWFLDEDGDYTHIPLGTMLANAEDSQAQIVAPSIAFMQDLYKLRLNSLACDEGDEMCKFQARHRLCSRRSVNFIELSFPLMRPRAFEAMARMEGVMDNTKSAWGLDRIWCSLSGELMGLPPRGQGGPTSACAILDSTTIIHRNFKTLPKYHNHQANVDNQDAYDRMKLQFPVHFAEPITSTACKA